VRRVLVADDERALRLLIRTTLENNDIEVIMATDGDEALVLAKSESPDLLVLDWMMPRKSGLEVVAELRQIEELAHIPVILLTARGQARDQEAARIAGVDMYLTKPFSPRELVAAVDKMLCDVSR
jgi:two-component system, OmpR family, phosphate regulon response regulator PhoB